MYAKHTLQQEQKTVLNEKKYILCVRIYRKKFVCVSFGLLMEDMLRLVSIYEI